MIPAPQPITFAPLFVPKPWGGGRLATLLNKHLPPDEPIGESWELVSLPGHESRVRDGPFAGRTLGELVAAWGPDLLGAADLADGRFPLLVKFLDACQNLSVQVHPKPVGDPHAAQTGVKHEAWYVLHADPGARLYVGLKPGVTADDVARAADTPAIAELLHAWDARPGDCFYLPSGTLHALGAGLVVAEVQTPSDVTYRAYDWDRVDSAGRPRTLHVAEALANIRYDVTAEMIRPQPEQVPGAGPTRATRVASCPRFMLDVLEAPTGQSWPIPPGRVRIWIILAGGGRFSTGGAFRCGDVALLPAASSSCDVTLAADTRWLEVTIPPA